MKRIAALTAAFLVVGFVKLAFSADWTSVLPYQMLPERGQFRSLLTPRTAAVEESTGGDLTDKQRLGKDLFFDPILSGNGKVSCSTCHDPNHGYASRGLPTGLDGTPLTRKAPSLYNARYSRTYFWDGHAGSLEEQAAGPLNTFNEMGNANMFVILDRLKQSPYKERFVRIYDVGVTSVALVSALAEYERTLTIDSPLDEYLNGPGNFTPSQARGYNLFRGKANCYKCHTVAGDRALTDHQFHNTGVGGKDFGLWMLTKKNGDEGKFKTPQLRGVRNHPPYMHDGSLKDLEDVVEFYNRGGTKHDVGLTDASVTPLGLSKDEKADLLAFLKVL